MLSPVHIARATPALLCGVLVLAGCGQVARPAASSAPRPELEVKALRVAKAPWTRIGAHASRLFSPASIWNKALPEQAPLDPRSGAIVATLASEVAEEQRAQSGPWINTTSYGVPILTVGGDQPTVPVALDHAPDEALSSAWSAVPLPSAAQPAEGTDGYMVVWQPSTDRMWEFWRLEHRDDGWHASWGGAIRHVSSNSGVYNSSAWPGAKQWWGATASSLALAGGAMTIEQLRSGQIDHALAVALPDVRAGVFASPAQRTDGVSSDPLALPEGAHLRLDPNLDLASLDMPPLTRAMAVAAQRYGIVVRDFASNVTFFGQAPTSVQNNPYGGPSGLFDGEDPAQLLASFPWAHLQVLKMELHPDP